LDQETENYYYRTRYYDDIAGRFTSVDPISFNITKCRTLDKNLFRYVRNSPIKFTDPNGENPFDPDNTNVNIKGPGHIPFGYGNYCGWGNAGFFTLPIDDMDRACQAHDACYQANGLSGWDVVATIGTRNIDRCSPQNTCGDSKAIAKCGCDKYLCDRIPDVQPGSSAKMNYISLATLLFCK
jgi:RHS repeat-associated protein